MKIVFNVFMLIMSINIYAQGEDYLITLKKDTIYGTVSIHTHEHYDRIIVKSKSGKNEFRLYQIHTIRLRGDFYDPINYKNKRTIGLRIISGELSFYKVRPADQFEFSEEVLIKENGEYSTVPNIGFKKLLSEFVSECSGLVEKIKNRTFTKSSIENIVRFYNTHCSSTDLKPAQEIKSRYSLPDLVSIVMDIQTKRKTGDTIPDYLMNALNEYKKADMSQMIEIFSENQ